MEPPSPGYRHTTQREYPSAIGASIQRNKKDVELFLALNTQIVMVQPNGQQIGCPINVQQ